MTLSTLKKSILIILLAICLLNAIWGMLLFQQQQQPGDHHKGNIHNSLAQFIRGDSRTYYTHDNRNLLPVKECTKEQRQNISYQLNLHQGGRIIGKNTRCPDASWIESFFQEEEDIGLHEHSFLGISVGCNKGYDAIRMARIGMSNPSFDSAGWRDILSSRFSVGACKQEIKPERNIIHSKRNGEFHCIEPMPSTFAMLKEGSKRLELESKNFILTQAAISSRDGQVQFPDGIAGDEYFGIGSCNKNGTSVSVANCVDVPMYSLDSYVDKFVKSKGPVAYLQIDVEGFDFEVLFGASSVLDRTLYLEFEYHVEGNWGELHVQDLVKLLDGKGFSCYWAGKAKDGGTVGRLWRITGCYFDIYDDWHGWSNIM